MTTSLSKSLTHVRTPSWATAAGSPHWCFEAWHKNAPEARYWTNALGKAHALYAIWQFHNKVYETKTRVSDWEVEKMGPPRWKEK
jgi:hypothetical protein